MMNLSLNDAAGVLFLVFAVAALGLSLHIARGKRRERQADREWTGLLAPGNDWDGTEWAWPPNVNQYLDDPAAYYEPAPTQPFPAVPASTVSGPLPVQQPVRYARHAPAQPPMDIDAYLAHKQAETEAWLAGMRAHTDGLVAYYASGTELVR